MNANPENGRADLSLDWVKRQLSMIGAVEPPSSLKQKLKAGIPAVRLKGPIMWQARSWRRGVRGAIAAAAVLVVVSGVAWLGAPWGRRAQFTADANSGLRPAYATDHNSLRPTDVNLCDTNSLR